MTDAVTGFGLPALALLQGGAQTAVDHTTREVSGAVTALFGAILVAMIVTLALEEKLHAKKSLIVGMYAFVALLLGAILLPASSVAKPSMFCL